MAGLNTGVRLAAEPLEGRLVPAHLVGGDLVIGGSAGDDRVIVRDATVGGEEMIRVNQNASVQYFDAAAVTGRVVFRGRGGDDAFGCWAPVAVDAGGGAGDDVLGVTTAAGATLRGGRGHDTLLGGPGDDLLLCGPGVDRIHGRGGNDLYDGHPPASETLEFTPVPGAVTAWVLRLGRGR